MGTGVLCVLLFLLGDGLVAIEGLWWWWWLSLLLHGRWEVCRRVRSGGDFPVPAGADAAECAKAQ